MKAILTTLILFFNSSVYAYESESIYVCDLNHHTGDIWHGYGNTETEASQMAQRSCDFNPRVCEQTPNCRERSRETYVCILKHHTGDFWVGYGSSEWSAEQMVRSSCGFNPRVCNEGYVSCQGLRMNGT